MHVSCLWGVGLKDEEECGYVIKISALLATHSSILAWRIPWTKEPGRLHSMRSQSQTQLSDSLVGWQAFKTMHLYFFWININFKSQTVFIYLYSRAHKHNPKTSFGVQLRICQHWEKNGLFGITERYSTMIQNQVD